MSVPRRDVFLQFVRRGRPAWAASLVIASLVAAVALLFQFVDPNQVTWLPKCPLHLFTGWHCPGCGATRMLHALAHGDFARAWTSNPLLFVLGPALAAYGLRRRWREGPGWASRVSPRAIWTLLVVLLVFAVLRNIPAYPFQLLAPR
jgi:hypothetical protein